MLRLTLLLFISLGILQAAQQSDHLLDQEASAPHSFSRCKGVHTHKPDTSIQVDDERTPLQKNNISTLTSTDTKRGGSFCSGRRMRLVVGAAVLAISGGALYGIGYLTGWLLYGDPFYPAYY